MITPFANLVHSNLRVKFRCQAGAGRSWGGRIVRGLRSGFTLIELLVVITIVGLLIALLMPSLQQARRSADRMTCAAQMRQVGTALHMYDDTYNELPGPANGTQSFIYLERIPHYPRGMHIGNQIFPFLGLPRQQNHSEIRPIRCPSHRRHYGPHTVENRLPLTYHFGHRVYREAPFPLGSYNRPEPGTDWGDRVKRLPVSITAIEQPSRVPVWSDNERMASWNDDDFVHHFDRRNYLFLDGRVQTYVLDDPDILRHPLHWPRPW